MEEFIPATLFFLEWAVIELFELYPYRLVHFSNREELLVSEGGNDPCGYIPYGSLGIRFVLGLPNAGWYDGCSVMLCHLMVYSVQLLIPRPAAVVNDCSRTVIRDEDLSYTAEVLVHVYMSFNPCGLLLIREGLNIRILTVCHNPDEDMGFCDLAGIGIDQFSLIPGPVNLHLFCRLTVDVHGGAVLVFVLLDVIAELRIHERIFAGLPAFLHVFCPQELLGHTVSQELLANVIIIRHSPGR